MNKYKQFILPSLILITFFLGVLSYILQFKINKFDKEVKSIENEISQIEMEIKILKSEFSHLTSITRIREISNQYFPNYKDISQKDFIRIIDIPINPKFE